MGNSNHSIARSTFWLRVIGLLIATLTVFVLAISGWAYALSMQVGRNSATIETLQEGHAAMRREIHEMWVITVKRKGGEK